MRASHDRPINLSFSQAVTVLMEACAVPPSGRTAFEARVRHLQRLGVPAHGPDQRSGRIDYGITELAAFATAFRLMAAFLVPTLAARYVNECWVQLAPFALAGAREVLPDEYLSRRPILSGTIALIEGNALADLGQKGRHDERNTGPLGKIVIIHADATDLASRVQGAGLVVDSRAYMPIIVARSAEVAMATTADLADELDRLRFAQ